MISQLQVSICVAGNLLPEKGTDYLLVLKTVTVNNGNKMNDQDNGRYKRDHYVNY